MQRSLSCPDTWLVEPPLPPLHPSSTTIRLLYLWFSLPVEQELSGCAYVWVSVSRSWLYLISYFVREPSCVIVGSSWVLPPSTPRVVCGASQSSLTWPYWSGISAQYATSACCSSDSLIVFLQNFWFLRSGQTISNFTGHLASTRQTLRPALSGPHPI